MQSFKMRPRASGFSEFDIASARFRQTDPMREGRMGGSRLGSGGGLTASILTEVSKGTFKGIIESEVADFLKSLDGPRLRRILYVSFLLMEERTNMGMRQVKKAMRLIGAWETKEKKPDDILAMEKEVIKKAVKLEGSASRASRILGIPQVTVSANLRKYERQEHVALPVEIMLRKVVAALNEATGGDANGLMKGRTARYFFEKNPYIKDDELRSAVYVCLLMAKSNGGGIIGKGEVDKALGLVASWSIGSRGSNRNPELEKRVVELALEKEKSPGQAAEKLGIAEATIRRKMGEHGIRFEARMGRRVELPVEETVLGRNELFVRHGVVANENSVMGRVVASTDLVGIFMDNPLGRKAVERLGEERVMAALSHVLIEASEYYQKHNPLSVDFMSNKMADFRNYAFNQMKLRIAGMINGGEKH